MFDVRGPERQRNDRVGSLQRRSVRPVWVDLTVLYPRPDPRRDQRARARPDPAGVDLSARVPGELLWWCHSTTGEWIGWACVAVWNAGEVFHMWTYVPAVALAPRDEVECVDGSEPS